jgi:hypothetical protein
MRLLRKKTELQIVDTLCRATETTAAALELVAEKDKEIQRLSRELQSLQVLRDWPCVSPSCTSPKALFPIRPLARRLG